MDEIENLKKQLEDAKKRRDDAENRKELVEKELAGINAEIDQKRKDLLARGEDAKKAAQK